MASKRRLRRKSCDRKVRHETEEAAWHATRATRKKTNSTGLRPYRCSNCSGWHVGHPIGARTSPLIMACRAARPHQ